MAPRGGEHDIAAAGRFACLTLCFGEGSVKAEGRDFEPLLLLRVHVSFACFKFHLLLFRFLSVSFWPALSLLPFSVFSWGFLRDRALRRDLTLAYGRVVCFSPGTGLWRSLRIQGFPGLLAFGESV